MRVFDPNKVGTDADGSAIYERAFERRVKVRRVTFHGHEPTYELGVAFFDPEPDIEQRVAKLQERVGGRKGRAGQVRGDTGG